MTDFDFAVGGNPPAVADNDEAVQGAATGEVSAFQSSTSQGQASALDRRTYIGSSDAPKIAGVSSYGSALSVWMEKRGDLEPKIESLRMWMGSKLEPIVLELYTAKTGKEPGRAINPATGLEIGPDDPPALLAGHPFIGAHPDYDGLEIKTTQWKRGYGEDGSTVTVDEMHIPIGHFVQMQHQMLVMGWSEMDLAVLIAHDDVWRYLVPRDDEVIGRLLIAEIELWGQVQSGERPADDDHESRKAYLRATFPKATEDMRSATPEEAVLLDLWREAKAEEKEAKARVEDTADAVKLAIGDNAGFIDEATWTLNKGRKTLDESVLQEQLTAIDRLDILTSATKRKPYRTLLDKRPRTETEE